MGGELLVMVPSLRHCCHLVTADLKGRLRSLTGMLGGGGRGGGVTLSWTPPA